KMADPFKRRSLAVQEFPGAAPGAVFAVQFARHSRRPVLRPVPARVTCKRWSPLPLLGWSGALPSWLQSEHPKLLLLPSPAVAQELAWLSRNPESWLGHAESRRCWRA